MLAPLYCCRKGHQEDSLNQPVFIIGAPRTGSTVLYQALTNCYEVAYIDNLAAVFYKNLPFGIWLSEKIFGMKPHNTFKSKFGNTREYGWHAPSECGQFWYRWLPLDDHYVDRGQFSASAVTEIHDEIVSCQRVSGLPMLFKNLNAGQRLRLIADAFPEAKIIYLKRDPRFTSASILKARKENHIKEGEWWSVKPKNFRQLMALSEVEMVVAQVYYLEHQIEKDLSLFSERNTLRLHYNELSEGVVRKIGNWLNMDEKSGAEVPEFYRDSDKKMDKELMGQISGMVEAYPFPGDVPE
ncbi:conserved hypothetical protein [gamma proteobacterium HTCC5015]|nr:conserved hypothetical protein [gamma proteobacterium HTCC5015]